jgi:periplasmic copper chaperone A
MVMRRSPGHRFAALAAVVAAALNAFVVEAAAADFTVGAIEIGNPWTRATPKGADVAGGYMKITNKGSAPDSLIGGSSAAADRFEVHEMSMVDGVMKMRPLAKGLEVKPGETVELKPGSFHIMLMGLKQPLEKGRKVKGTLIFEKAGKVDIEYTVEALGAGSSAPSGHGHGR